MTRRRTSIFLSHFPFPARQGVPWSTLRISRQTSPHRPWLVVSRSTCPQLPPSPHADSFLIGTAAMNTRTHRQGAADFCPTQLSTPFGLHPADMRIAAAEGEWPHAGFAVVRAQGLRRWHDVTIMLLSHGAKQGGSLAQTPEISGIGRGLPTLSQLQQARAMADIQQQQDW